VYANQQALEHYQLAEGWLAEGRVTFPPSSGQAWSEDEITRWRADLAERKGQIQALVGDYEAADAAYTYSWQAWHSLDDWRGAARVLNRLSFLYFTQYNYVQAIQYAEAALAALPDAKGRSQSEIEGRMALRATSLTYLGLSAWTQGHYDDALQPLEQALGLFEQLGSDLNGLARCLNSLALVHMGRGDLTAAEGYSVRSMTLRQQIGDRRGEAWCWHNQGQMAMMRGDLAAAREKLETARAIFTEIEHPNGLDRCTQTLAELEQAEEAAVQMRQVLVRLPHIDAPTGRPMQDDDYVPVTWTVFASEDSTIAGAAARRRQQLLRLLQEAESQGAAPTVDDLAEALQVSQPTIKRDLAALRRAGHEVRTRGSRRG
jgi:tetratricopeptide (TPR) repeat protein